MSHFVLDASVAGAWLLEDEDDPVANAAISRLATEFRPHLTLQDDPHYAERREAASQEGRSTWTQPMFYGVPPGP